MKIQIDLSDKENEIVSIYKIIHKLKTKSGAVKEIIMKYKGDKK